MLAFVLYLTRLMKTFHFRACALRGFKLIAGERMSPAERPIWVFYQEKELD